MSDLQKKIAAGVLTVGMLVLLVVMVCRTFRGEETPNDTRTLMDSKTGELFEVPTKDVKPYPMVNPKTGEDTLYRTEICYWGEECRKRGGTRVILNGSLGKKGPTYCPVCGHVVRAHNPRPPDYHPDQD